MRMMTVVFTKYAAELRTDIKQRTRLCGIKNNTYGSGLNLIAKMVALAKTDFPFLIDGDFWVVSYDGDRWKRQTGIEFEVPTECPLPKDYQVCDRLEYIFAGNKS
jgi:hypothetical protein